MNPHFDRARAQFNNRRYDLAESEFRQAIAFEPNHAPAYGLLAACVSELGRNAEAVEIAGQAILLAPDQAYGFYALSVPLYRLNRLAEARVAIYEAIRINPEESLYFGQLAMIELRAGLWQKSLEAAEKGMALNPEEANCNIARVRSLACLGRRAEAADAAKTALEFDPGSAAAHTNLGYILLMNGKLGSALDSFREALRINPNLEWARKGLMEGLRRRNPLYWPLRHWSNLVALQRYGDNLSFAAIALLAVSLLDQLLGWQLRIIEAWEGAILGVTTITCFAWLSKPLGNTTLLVNRYSRALLSADEIRQAKWVCVLLIPMSLSFFDLATDHTTAAALALITYTGSAMLIAASFTCPALFARRMMFALAFAFLATGIIAINTIPDPNARFYLGNRPGPGTMAIHLLLLLLFVSHWIANRLSRLQPAKTTLTATC